MPTIRPAQPYNPDATGSNGNAKDMLLCQFQFPVGHFSEGEALLTGIDCDIMQREPERATACFNRHTGMNEGGFNFWLKSASNEQVMEFVKDMLQAVKAEWTGFRVTVTVNKKGWDVHTLELFAKHPKTHTQVETNNPHQRFFLSETREDRMSRLLEHITGQTPRNKIQ